MLGKDQRANVCGWLKCHSVQHPARLHVPSDSDFLARADTLLRPPTTDQSNHHHRETQTTTVERLSINWFGVRSFIFRTEDSAQLMETGSVTAFAGNGDGLLVIHP